ncbi:MAG: methyl-accepting chemotaxis protein [Planctomycetota bacterium]
MLKRLSIGQRLATIPVLVAIAGSGLVALMCWQVSHAESGSAAINLAGRQRMLNQKYVHEVLELNLGRSPDTRETKNIIRESLDVLSEGGEHRFGKISAARDPKLVASLQAQREEFERLFRMADRLVSGAASQDEAALETFVQESERVHEAAQSTVDVLSSVISDRHQASLWGAAVLGLLVITITGGWAFVCGNSVVGEVHTIAEHLHDMSHEKLERVSNKLRNNASGTSNQAMLASSIADQVRQNAQSLSRAVAQFEASIIKISDNASTAVIVARNAVTVADQTNHTVTRLGESSAEIGNVIKVINSIAEQTNLLALNATIEAARAGEAGKGFAVVANEVKELAKETSRATEDIVSRVSTIQADTRQAVDAIGLVGKTIAEINESQNAIAGAVEEQTTMTSEISRHITDLASGSDEIAGNISHVADTARCTVEESDETLSAALDIERHASALLTLVGRTTSSQPALPA